MIALAAGFLSISATVMSVFDIARVGAEEAQRRVGAGARQFSEGSNHRAPVDDEAPAAFAADETKDEI